MLANYDAAKQLDSTSLQAAFGSLVAVENPTRFTPNTIDCVSCHLATPAEKDVVTTQFGLVEAGNPNAFAPDPRFVTVADMAAIFDSSNDFSVHAFSYLGEEPTVNQRVVNETAAIVAYLNTMP